MSSSSGQLSEPLPIPHTGVETSVFTLPPLAPGSYSLNYNISIRPQGPKAMYRKAWCWVNNLEKKLIASNVGLPRDWPTSKEVSTKITVTASSDPIVIKVMVEADDPVELMPKEEFTEKDYNGNDVTKTRGCFWSVS